MKTRKTVALVLAALLIGALVVPAFAANTDLGDFTAINSDTQKGWCTNGVDNITTALTIEQLTSAKTLILELSKAPTGGLQIIWQGDGDSWTWNQTDGVIPDAGSDQTKIEIDLASTLKNYEAFKASTQVKVFLGYYSDNIDGLGVTKAYLVSDAAATTPAASTNVKTGAEQFVGVAFVILVLSAMGAVVLFRKMKKA